MWCFALDHQLQPTTRISVWLIPRAKSAVRAEAISSAPYGQRPLVLWRVYEAGQRGTARAHRGKTGGEGRARWNREWKASRHVKFGTRLCSPSDAVIFVSDGATMN